MYSNRHYYLAVTVLILSVALCALWYLLLRPAPPAPVTPTARPPTATPAPTYTPIPTLAPPTDTPEPLPTITQYPTPTHTPLPPAPPTPTPQMILLVDTGWDLGYLHFRHGPSPRFLPIWPIGWLPEGSRLIFLDCATLRPGFPWVYVGWVDEGGQTWYGWVYSDFTDPVMCQEAE